MNIRRKKRENNFTITDNSVINDKNLSPAALGVLIYILSKTDDWTAHKNEIVKRFDSAKTIKTTPNFIDSVFKELKAAGYFTIKPLYKKHENKTILCGSEYIFFDKPQLPTTDNVPTPDNVPMSDNLRGSENLAPIISTDLSNKDLNKKETKEEKSDFKKSQTPANENLDLDNSTQFAMTENSPEISEQKEPTQPTARKNKKEKEIEKLIDFIDSYPKPEKVDASLYEKLQDFVKSRIERGEMITAGGWGLLIGKTQRAQEKYGVEAICSHIENGIIANSWKSPFFNGWEEKMPVVAKNAITAKTDNEKPFENEAQEIKYQKVLRWIESKFEFILNAKCQIRQINRKEFTDLFDFENSKTVKNFAFGLGGKDPMFKFYCGVLQKLGANEFTRNDVRSLHSILIDALNKAKEAKKNG